jgi:hypothetical protein
MAEPYERQQRGIYFKDDPTSGATLGYHCTVVRVHSTSVRRFPDHPNRWIYRVFVPFFDSHMDISARELYVTGDIDTQELPPELQTRKPACEVRFDSELGEDNDRIDGAFRLPGREWERFSFRKCEQQISDYQLRVPVEGAGLGGGKLRYNVPMGERLDRHFVLVALSEIVGVKKWQSN